MVVERTADIDFLDYVYGAEAHLCHIELEASCYLDISRTVMSFLNVLMHDRKAESMNRRIHLRYTSTANVVYHRTVVRDTLRRRDNQNACYGFHQGRVYCHRALRQG